MVEPRETKFKAVSRARPCEVCAGDHKCARGDDGVILCGRRSGPQAGFVCLGQSEKDSQWTTYRREGDPLLDGDRRHRSTPSKNGSNHKPSAGWDAKIQSYACALTPDRRQQLAEALGLPEAVFAALPALGYMATGPHRDPPETGPYIGPCWTFPEHDAAGHIIGLNCRYMDGQKKAYPGASRGLTIPAGWLDREGPVFLPEGASCTLALTAMGLAAIGRPSNKAGVDHVTDLLRAIPPERQIIVLGEFDANDKGEWPGRDGAAETAAKLAEKLSRPVEWALPPAKAKDLWAWVLSHKPDPTIADVWQDLGQQFLMEIGGKLLRVKPKEETPGVFRFQAIDSATLDSTGYRPSWLVRQLLVASQPAVMGGPLKCMKTSLSVDLAVSLSSATPFLSHFAVCRKVRTVILSGESGPFALQDTARRVCRERGITLAHCDLHWCFKLPKLASAMDLIELRDGLKWVQAEVCILDPLYLSLLSGDDADASSASNLYATGPLLLAAAEACLSVGVTPAVCHHFRRSIPAPPATPELTWLCHSGIAEFARHWLLLSRREEFKPGTGIHRLWLTAGGSIGHTGLYGVDIDEGQLAEDFTGRTWKVTVKTGSELRRETEEQRQAESERRREQKDGEIAVKVLNALDQLAGEDGIAVFSKVRALARINGETMNRIVRRLSEEGTIQEVRTMTSVGGNRKGKRDARGLKRGNG
jgi:hypothetical protein